MPKKNAAATAAVKKEEVRLQEVERLKALKAKDNPKSPSAQEKITMDAVHTAMAKKEAKEKKD